MPLKVKVINREKKEVGEIELPEVVFARPWNADLVHQVVVSQMANRRKPWAHAKGRSEVSGGGRKPWRQKGTGRARHGSIRSPLWKGGGVTHGPLKDRVLEKKINRKMRLAALASVLSRKLREEEITFFDTLEIAQPKTKQVWEMLQKILSLSPKRKKADVLLVAVGEHARVLTRAARNLQKTKVLPPRMLNVYDALNFKRIFIEKEAVQEIVARYRCMQRS
ncbi:50S ribosomal protein L4 [Candidatus Parcubacteria bacterium]|nr:MAG: 50S ribosomal protein L4 [Candidatus Parcubacteria bacterium]